MSESASIIRASPTHQKIGSATHSQSKSGDSNLNSKPNNYRRQQQLWRRFGFFISVFLPVAAAAGIMILFQLEPFDPAPLPNHELTQEVMVAPMQNNRMLHGSEVIGRGELYGPEDIIYDPKSQIIYTGCFDGWIKRVTVADSVADSLSHTTTVVNNWVNTGGRPLGLAFGRHDNLIVADANKGLLNLSKDGVVELLTSEAEGVSFNLTDGVEVADDGIIYFTDASSKYSLKDFMWDILEGKPNGRFMSFDPSTKMTKVLVDHLYFANGVTVSPDQSYVVFCETVMRRCRKYHIKGKKKGTVEKFIDHLPGMPDNIHYDGNGHYWIALASEATFSWDLALRYPLVRKFLAIVERYIGGLQNMEKNGGVMIVDLEGKPTAHYCDLELTLVSSGIKIGDHLYCGSVVSPYIIRLNLTQYPTHVSSALHK